MSFLQQAMVGVVEAQNGTGKLARIEGIQVAGKTGTAQNPHGEDHACFIAYAPADKPAIALAVIIENAGGGGAVAAPIAREVMRAYFRIEDPPEAPQYEAGEAEAAGDIEVETDGDVDAANGNGDVAGADGVERGGGGETGGGSHAQP
jgi:membrane peptidoglycan carboxypeptidase